MNKNPSAAVHPNVFLLAWAVIGFGSNRLWPLPLPSSGTISLGGYVLWGVGGILLVWAQVEFRRHKTTDSHSKPTTTLITSGPFRLSRHPVYVGLTSIMLGIAIVYHSTWSLVLTIPFVIAVQRLTVVKEEAYLEREFADTYRNYRRRVRQWL